MAYRPDRGWGISSGSGAASELAKKLAELPLRIAKLEAQGEPKVERGVKDQKSVRR